MDAWNEKVRAAHDMVSALCKPRGSKGSRDWTMSIPARPDHDPDLVITSGLRAAEKEIDRLATENAELRKQCAAFHTEASDHYRAFLAANAELERVKKASGYARVALTDEWKKIHDQIQAENAELALRRAETIAMSDQLASELAAANATLDKLREEFKHDCGCLATCCANARAILYPTPETHND